jgi:hypothetical protein
MFYERTLKKYGLQANHKHLSAAPELAASAATPAAT